MDTLLATAAGAAPPAPVFVPSKVEYLDHMGTDLSVVNAARVSFDKRSEWREVEEEGFDERARRVICRVRKYVLHDRDAALLHYLARGMSTADFDEAVLGIEQTCFGNIGDVVGRRAEIREALRKYRARPLHWSPFAHVMVSVRVTTSLAIARQLETHQVGLAANEVSRRYVDAPPEMLAIDSFRSRPTDRKQGSGEAHPRTDLAQAYYSDAVGMAARSYARLLDLGVAPEQARFVLPTATMTTWIWTGSLYAFASVCRQRERDDHAQKEVRDVALGISEICGGLFPEAWRALRAY